MRENRKDSDGAVEKFRWRFGAAPDVRITDLGAFHELLGSGIALSA
jgi:hypothetical protein